MRQSCHIDPYYYIKKDFKFLVILLKYILAKPRLREK